LPPLARNLYVTGYGGNLAWKMTDDLLSHHADAAE
jgi:hypothetical protein